MVTKDNLRAAVENSIALVYQRYILSAKPENSDKLFCFYEGHDANYYSGRIKNILNKNYFNFSCKNKTNVLKVYNKIKHQKNNYNLLFFVDRDFDDKLNNPDIYETCTYSIENFYIYDSCLKTILKDIFYINDDEDNYSKTINFYNEQLLEYSSRICLFNAWYHALKVKKKEENLESTNVILDNKLPKGFCSLEIGNIESRYTLQDIFSSYPKAINITESEVNNSFSILDIDDNFKVLRGKFLIEFLIKFLEFLVLDSKSNKNYIYINSTFHTDRIIILGQLSQYAYTPDCLVEYLIKFKDVA
jgi:hypothetical protein